ncbi:alpha/beta hydrolase family protein [Dyadobacter psychrotolerans]|uniref:Phospholipase n=1 Tax=Dyadobacter psychrotolerans TaxID=2541721 RepID=A0A4R5DFJ3_9BACT|nr:lipase family protein [Dyadobacter psychrotolerans]TDE12732.1 phospholipase [Dyadobacter psychrotolerans]
MQVSKSIISFRKIYISLIWCLLFLSACNNDNKVTPDPDETPLLVSSTQVGTISKETVIQTAAAQDQALKLFAQLYVKNGVKTYRITYKTKNTDGAEITASGALIVPVTSQAASLISIQHGTISSDAEAPSNYGVNSESTSLGTLFGALGYIVAYPDYIGYGASKDYPHPYEHRASLASASLDMLRASKEFLKNQSEVKWDEKLYIGGYSEGGFATMSLQKKIEEEASAEFNLRASSCGAGAYDKTAFMNEVVNNTTHGIANYNRLYLWVMLTYDRIYKIGKPASYYFKEPYATQIGTLGTGYSIAQSFNTILTDSFKKALNDGTDKSFVDAVADNNVYNWKPKTPTRLYHGDKDPLVFYFNSVNAVTAMKKLGAPNVELITVAGGTHASSVTPFLLGTYTFFTETK